MSNTWVYKWDGTIQCQEGGEISLDVMREYLAGLIGAVNVISAEKRHSPNPVIELCGSPSAHVNAYEITPLGLNMLFRGIRGPSGFQVWPDHRFVNALADPGPVVPWPTTIGDREFSDRPIPWPWLLLDKLDLNSEEGARAMTAIVASISSVGAQPTTLSEIIGRRCRVMMSGEPYTQELIADRVNIILDDNRRIEKIWFG